MEKVMTRYKPPRSSARIPSFILLITATLYGATAAQADYTHDTATLSDSLDYLPSANPTVNLQGWSNTGSESLAANSFAVPSTNYDLTDGNTVSASAHYSYFTTSTLSNVDASAHLSLGGPASGVVQFTLAAGENFTSTFDQEGVPLACWIIEPAVTGYVAPGDTIGLFISLSAQQAGVINPGVSYELPTEYAPSGFFTFPAINSFGYGQSWNGASQGLDWEEVNIQVYIEHLGGPDPSYIDVYGDPGSSIVPEPGTLTLLVSALLGLGAFHLRRRGAKG
jgi:hypothetical protein